MGESHARLGVASWFATTAAVTLTPVEPMDGWEVAYGAVLAGATSHGWLSPDMDGHRWIGKVIPGGHRGPLHCPDLIAALGVVLVWASWGSPARWMTAAAVVGWLSHLLGDWLFGGVPFLLAGGRRRYGLGLDTDGWFERLVVRRVLLPVTFLLAALAVGVTSGLVEIPPALIVGGVLYGVGPGFDEAGGVREEL